METTSPNKNGTPSNGRRFCFDEFEIDPANRLLRRDGKEVPLTGKVFDLLLVFVENSGRLLEKDELLERIWPNEFVEEGNLARNVSTLRKSLGDTGRDHKYIVTVQGRGYRFVADPSEIEPAQLSQHVDLDQNKNGLRGFLYSRFWLTSIGGVVLVALAILLFQSGFAPTKLKKAAAIENIRQTKLTQDGNVYGAAISPDGQFLVYTKLGANDERTLCVRQIATGSVLDLQPPQRGIAYWGASIAPDNSFVYYNVKEQDKDYGIIYRIPLFGGQPPRKLTDMVRGGPVISPNGTRIGFTRMDKHAGTVSLFTISGDGSDEKRVMSLDLDSNFNHIDYSPDNKNLIYVIKRHEPEKEFWYIAEMPIDGGPETRIGDPSDTKIISAKWLADKSGLIVNELDKETKQPQLFYVTFPEGSKRRITSDVKGFYGFSMTSDGRSIVTNQTLSHHNFWISAENGKNPFRITSGTERHFDAVAWIGNEYIAFDEDEGGSYYNRNIWQIRSDGGERQQLTFGNGNNRHPAVSPDRKTIVFVSERSGKSQLWLMSSDGSTPRQLTDFPYNIFYPQFSHDGEGIYFGTFVQGKGQVWQTRIDGSETKPLFDKEVYQWSVSPDGKRIAYSILDPEAKRIQVRIRSLLFADSETVLDVAPETWLTWSMDGKSIYYNTIEDDVRNVWRKELNDSPPKKVTKFNDEQVFRCAWSEDGSKSACIRHMATYDAVMIRFE